MRAEDLVTEDHDFLDRLRRVAVGDDVELAQELILVLAHPVGSIIRLECIEDAMLMLTE